MDDRAPILEFLKRGRWFGGLDAALQRAIVERAQILRFAPGELLAEEGMPPAGLYAVLAGHVRVMRRLGNGTEVPVHVAGKGFWTGEYATFSGQRVIGSIVAATSVRALYLPAAEFERLVEDDPRRFRAFMKLMLERYRFAYGAVAELQGLSSEQVLARRLAGLAHMWRDDLSLSGPVDLRVSQAELAAMLGLSRQRVSALLHRLEAQGRIQLGFRSVRVLS
jgi:CRP-like cAMP-binding protein